MRKFVRVELKAPLELPDKTTVSTLEASVDVSIHRDPPSDWPAELVAKGPWGEVRADWAGTVSGASTTHVPGPSPHSVVPLTAAKAFVDYLTESHDDERYLFRGVANSSYDLLPTALRTSEPLPFGKVLTTNLEQVEREAKMAMHFFDASHYQGLTIPRWAEVVRTIDMIRDGAAPPYWPPEELLEFLALAQHHLVPTRLLDWTLDPMVAAYFAACDFDLVPSPLVAVWILDRRAGWTFDVFMSGPRLLAPIIVPYDVNRNAHAQRGVFTAAQVIDSAHYAKAPSREPLDQLLSLYSVVDPPNGIRKVTLPRSETAELLRLLDRRRINSGTMFPGYSGAAKAAKERAFWSK